VTLAESYFSGACDETFEKLEGRVGIYNLAGEKITWEIPNKILR